MPDYHAYEINGEGKKKDVGPEGLAKFLGIAPYDADLMLRGMDLVKLICCIAGRLESPHLIWNDNMPDALVEFVGDHVIKKLQSNPSWSHKDFDWSLLYEDDKQTLKYR